MTPHDSPYDSPAGAAGPLVALDFPKLRRHLIKVEDMKLFGNTSDEKDQLTSRSNAILGLLTQRGSTPATLAEMTVGLFALQHGVLPPPPPLSLSLAPAIFHRHFRRGFPTGGCLCRPARLHCITSLHFGSNCTLHPDP